MTKSQKITIILLIVYVIWEFALKIWSPEANIRVDLLFIYPILIVLIIVSLIKKQLMDLKNTLKNISILFIFTLFNCTQVKKEKTEEIPIEKSKEIEIIKEIDSVQIIDSIQNVTKISKKKSKPGLFFLTDLIGKYPAQEKIFDNTYLAKRLKKIERFNFDNMKRDWNTENPLTIENQIIHSSGCRAHSCPDSGYELFVDLKNDNINIYFFMGNTLRIYKEKGWIELPKIYQDEIDIKMENAKIGSTSDDLTSKYSINPKK